MKNLLYKIAIQKSMVAWLENNDLELKNHMDVIEMCNNEISSLERKYRGLENEKLDSWHDHNSHII